MEILLVFNNNVVLARDDSGRDVVLTGRGLGFQAQPGQPVDPERVVRTFVPVGEAEPLARLLADIPPDNIALVTKALTQAGLDRALEKSPATIVAIADHIGFALERVRTGEVVEYPLLAEVKGLYPDEYVQAERVRAAIGTFSGVELPPAETVAITLHLVGAGFAGADLAGTYTMTTLIQQLLDIVEQDIGVRLDPTSTSVGRFVTHLRYLVARIHDHQQLDSQLSELGSAILDNFPHAADGARRLATVLELRLGSNLTQDEVSYLTLHVARLMAQAA